MTVRKKLYCAVIQPHTDYCSVVWHQLTLEQEKKVEMIQNIGINLRSAKVSNWHRNETEAAVDHTGSEEEALCIKASTEMLFQSGTCIPP